VEFTGAGSEAPLGFPIPATIALCHRAAHVDNNVKLFPTGNICALRLNLPVLADCNRFSTLITEGILQAPTFGFK